MMKYVISAIFMILLVYPSSAAEDTLFLGQETCRWHYDYENDLIYFSCADNVGEEVAELVNYTVRIVDPDTMSVIMIIEADNLPVDFATYEDGKYLLLATCEMQREFHSGNSGALHKIDLKTGKTIDSIVFDKSPELMEIDNAHKFVYMKLQEPDHKSYRERVNLEETNLLCKVDLDKFEVITDRPVEGRWSCDLVITPDDSRIFIDTYSGDNMRSADTFLCVYRTDDLSLLNTIRVLPGFFSMAMCQDGRLLLSICESEVRTIPTLYIYDTDTYEMVDSYYYGLANIFRMTCEPGMEHIYCTTFQPVESNAGWGSKYILKPSSKVFIINTVDFSSEMVQLGDEPFGLAAVRKQNGNRWFYTIDRTGKVTRYSR